MLGNFQFSIRWFCMLILFSSIFSLRAEKINLIGTIRSESYQPISGAKVHLKTKNLMTNSDSRGNFKINAPLSIVKNTTKALPLSASIYGSTLYLNLSSPSIIEISIYNINGRKVFGLTTDQYGTGIQKITLPLHRLGRGMYMVYITHEKQECGILYAYTDELFTVSSMTFNSSSNKSVRPYQVSKTAIDTLLVIANGFLHYNYLLSSLNDTNIVISMKPHQYDNTPPGYPYLTTNGGNGNVTTYGSVTDPAPSQGGACNCESTEILYFAAINVNHSTDDGLGQWQNGQACGRCARVRVRTRDGWRSTIVRIMDKCPDEYCGIDLGGAPARDVMGNKPGRYSGDWEWVSCVGIEGVSDGPPALHVKGNPGDTNAYWCRIQVRNGDGGIAEIKARKAGSTNWESLLRDLSIENYFIVPEYILKDPNDWEFVIHYELGSSATVQIPGNALTLQGTNYLLK